MRRQGEEIETDQTPNEILWTNLCLLDGCVRKVREDNHRTTDTPERFTRVKCSFVDFGGGD